MPQNKNNQPGKAPLTYNYHLLDPIFTDFVSPCEVARHLDQLLFILCWYQEHEGIQGYWDIYQDIYMLKEVLLKMEPKK